MVEDLVGPAPEAREAAMFEALVDTARRRQQAAFDRSSLPPRFLLESAKSMAAHTAMSEERMLHSLALMALWQLYLQSALGARTWDFAAVREHMPWSYERVRNALARMEWRPQVVSTVFHMAAFPLVCVLIGAVWRDMHDGPLHLLVASRNMAWFRTEKNRWVGAAVDVVSTDPAGLRRLLAGLKDGSVRRLLILADGPQAPGTPGARALDGVSSALAIRTALLAKIHALGIPLALFKHEWDANRLLVTHCAPLDPATLRETETIDVVVRHVEDLLRRHPEQWLNWSAASIRT
jgi:hypothetical protein